MVLFASSVGSIARSLWNLPAGALLARPTLPLATEYTAVPIVAVLVPTVRLVAVSVLVPDTFCTLTDPEAVVVELPIVSPVAVMELLMSEFATHMDDVVAATLSPTLKPTK